MVTFVEAARARKALGLAACTPLAATEHMPFAGHRSVAQIDAAEAAARGRRTRALNKAMEFGFDPKGFTKSKTR